MSYHIFLSILETAVSSLQSRSGASHGLERLVAWRVDKGELLAAFDGLGQREQ